MSVFSERDAEQAIDLVTPLVEGFLEQGWIRRQDFHLIISRRLDDGSFEVLAEKSFGDKGACAKYAAIAEGKTSISSSTGLSSREVQLMKPYLLQTNDVLYWGSAIEGDIIVAGSGVQPWVDEAIAKSCLAICMALIQQTFDGLKVMAEGAGGTHYDS